MRKVELTPEDALFTAELVNKALLNGGKFEVIIKQGSGMSYQVKVRLWYLDSNSKVDILHLTYWLAYCIGSNLTDKDYLRFSGVGYSRGDHVIGLVARALEKLTGAAVSGYPGYPVEVVW